MQITRRLMVQLFSAGVAEIAAANVRFRSFGVSYVAGSVACFKGGQRISVLASSSSITLEVRRGPSVVIDPRSVIDICYGTGVLVRVATELETAIATIGMGPLTANIDPPSENYVGLVWVAHLRSNGLTMRAEKAEVPELVAALQRVTGKQPVDTNPSSTN